MRYLTKRKQFEDKVIFDCENDFNNKQATSKERLDDLDSLLMPIFKEEIKKIKNKTSSLN
jgi:hypothetical protein